MTQLSAIKTPFAISSFNKTCFLDDKDHSVQLPHLGRNQVSNYSSSYKVQVIIATRWRSGSSFAGEILNNDPDFIYFFELLLGIVTSENEFGQEHVTTLQDILRCEFTNKMYTWWDGQIPTNCERSQSFGRSVLCGKFRKELKTTSKSSAIIENICHSRKHIAMKTVRVPDLKYLKPSF